MLGPWWRGAALQVAQDEWDPRWQAPTCATTLLTRWTRRLLPRIISSSVQCYLCDNAIRVTPTSDSGPGCLGNCRMRSSHGAQILWTVRAAMTRKSPANALLNMAPRLRQCLRGHHVSPHTRRILFRDSSLEWQPIMLQALQSSMYTVPAR